MRQGPAHGGKLISGEFYDVFRERLVQSIAKSKITNVLGHPLDAFPLAPQTASRFFNEGKTPVNRILRQSSHEEATLGTFPTAVLVCHDMGQSILPALPFSELLEEPLEPFPEGHGMPPPLEDAGSAMTNLISLSFGEIHVGEMHVLQDADITVCLWDDHELGDDLEFHIGPQFPALIVASMAGLSGGGTSLMMSMTCLIRTVLSRTGSCRGKSKKESQPPDAWSVHAGNRSCLDKNTPLVASIPASMEASPSRPPAAMLLRYMPKANYLASE